jgi:polysaccharide deacetylase 2 family uncharacterized protein YibQ
VARKVLLIVIAVLSTACASSGHGRPDPARPTTPTGGPTGGPTSSSTAPAAQAPAQPIRFDDDVAALPDGHGARIAIVVDDVGGVDTYLFEYLTLSVPITLSVIPTYANATKDDAAITRFGKQVLLHIPLANRAGPGGIPDRGLGVGADAATVDRWLTTALARVPHAVGANNHEGPYGSSSEPLMRTLLLALQQRHLFFLDSVTSQRTVGFALEAAYGMPPRVNNVFTDHFESDADSRSALLRLARIAATSGSAIGICHVFHQYELHALQALSHQLEAKGFVFAPLSEVTNALTAEGLDRGVRSRL